MDIVYEACRILKAVLQARAPYSTDNFAMNAIQIDGARGRVIVNCEAVKDAWGTSERKRQSLNNSGGDWIDEAIREALPIIQRTLSGRVSHNDLEYYERARNEHKEAPTQLSNMQKPDI